MRAEDDPNNDYTLIEDQEDSEHTPPPEMMAAPPWAQFLFIEQKKDRRGARKRDLVIGRRMFLLEKTVADMNTRLGSEAPDGTGGTGFVGETRRNTQDIETLKGERNFVRGAIAAITAAGTLIVYGFSAWMKNVFQGQHK